MKKIILSLFLMAVGVVANAYDFQVGDLFYEIRDKTKKTVAVVAEKERLNDYGWNLLVSGHITIPSTVTYNGTTYTVDQIYRAFHNCWRITGVTIPNTVKYIGWFAFTNCTHLTEVNLGDSVETIAGSFEGCTALKSINIPKSVKNIGGFTGCAALTDINFLGDTLDLITESAFQDCTSLTSLNLPNTIKAVKADAFKDCTSLTKVTISNIGAWCNTSFANVYSNPLYYAKHLYFDGEELSHLVIPDTVTTIGNYAFANCFSLKSINIGNSVESIGTEAFDGCENTESLKIGESVKSIGGWAFYNCKSLKNFDIPNSVTTIGHLSFYNCNSVTNINIPDSVTTIGNYAFSDCTSLIDVKFGNSLTSLGNYTFNNCNSLTNISLGKSVISIGTTPFNLCQNLASITIDEENTMYDSRDNCNAIIEKASNTLVMGCYNSTVPNTVKAIGDRAFYGLTRLTNISLGDSVEQIGNGSFSNCYNLAQITLPEALKDIKSGAFNNCVELRDIYCYATTPPTCKSSELFTKFEDIFNKVRRNLCVLHVPQGALHNYYLADVWWEFDNIVEMEPVNLSLKGDVNMDEVVNAGDVAMVYKVILGGEGDNNHIANSDVNGDGAINTGDISAIYDIILKQ